MLSSKKRCKHRKHGIYSVFTCNVADASKSEQVRMGVCVGDKESSRQAGSLLTTGSGAEGNRTPVRTQIQCTSTVIVGVLTFPPESAHRQAQSFSSFMNFLLSQSFDNRVFRWLTPATFVADYEDRWAATRQLMLNYLQRLILNWTFYVVSSHEQLLHLQWARRNQYNPLL